MAERASGLGKQKPETLFLRLNVHVQGKLTRAAFASVLLSGVCCGFTRLLLSSLVSEHAVVGERSVGSLVLCCHHKSVVGE